MEEFILSAVEGEMVRRRFGEGSEMKGIMPHAPMRLAAARVLKACAELVEVGLARDRHCSQSLY